MTSPSRSSPRGASFLPDARPDARFPLVRKAVRAAGVVALATAVALASVRLPSVLAPPTGAGAPTGAAPRDDVRILASAPTTLDPARQGDLASGAVTAQLFETLTALDPTLTLRPALAASWSLADGGRRATFALRPNLTFSDGSPLTANDVVASWRRLLDPSAPSPLASLLDDVDGARAYRLGQTSDAASVGITAPDPGHVEVRLDRPASDFATIIASPTFGVVPPALRSGGGDALEPGRFVGSGGYVLAAESDSELTLTANDRYWAGRPPIPTVHVVTSIGGRSPIDAFDSGDLDYAPISDFDASWIAYDATLGPQLRTVPALALDYYGFDTSRPPFDDVRLRRAVATAIDWKRIVALAATASQRPADGMVPDGVPGRPVGAFGPAHDPAAARALLAEAGHPGGSGLGPITIMTAGFPYDEAVAAQLRATLGLDVRIETMDFDAYQERLVDDPPQIWAMSWIADYPGANDFLGVLLASDASNNYGRWRSAEFDAAVEAAGRAPSPTAAADAFRTAESIVQRDAPVIPLATGSSWALSRTGLLGAGQNGLGILRFSGLAWGS